jgi:hypothetical protein
MFFGVGCLLCLDSLKIGTNLVGRELLLERAKVVVTVDLAFIAVTSGEASVSSVTSGKVASEVNAGDDFPSRVILGGVVAKEEVATSREGVVCRRWSGERSVDFSIEVEVGRRGRGRDSSSGHSRNGGLGGGKGSAGSCKGGSGGGGGNENGRNDRGRGSGSGAGARLHVPLEVVTSSAQLLVALGADATHPVMVSLDVFVQVAPGRGLLPTLPAAEGLVVVEHPLVLLHRAFVGEARAADAADQLHRASGEGPSTLQMGPRLPWATRARLVLRSPVVKFRRRALVARGGECVHRQALARTQRQRVAAAVCPLCCYHRVLAMGSVVRHFEAVTARRQLMEVPRGTVTYCWW